MSGRCGNVFNPEMSLDATEPQLEEELQNISAPAAQNEREIFNIERNRLYQITYRKKRANRDNSLFNKLETSKEKLRTTERVLSELLNAFESDKMEIRETLTSLLKEVMEENANLHMELKKYRTY